MDKNLRKEFILRVLQPCDSVYCTREKEWGNTIGALGNSLDQKGMGAMLMGGEVLELVNTKEKDSVTLAVYFGVVEGSWGPLCAVLEFCGYKLGTYCEEI